MGFVRDGGLFGGMDSETLDPLGVFGAKTSRLAQESAERTAEQALAEQRRQFDIGQERLQPFYEEAVPAIGLQAALAGARGPEAQREAFQQFQDSPGTQFLREQGLRMIASQGGAQGLGGGERLREINRFGQGLAMQGLQDQFNRLGVISGQGGNIGSRQAELGARFAGATSDVLGRQSQQVQSALQAQQEQSSQAVGAGLGAMATIFASDERLKENIVKIGELKSGLNWYSWDWKDEAKDIVGDQVTEGVIAQEAQKVFPHAVIAGEDGYLRVDYKELH
jgi:hypothetical protein